MLIASLIALLIPIGIAMDNTGAAKYLGGFILDFSSRYYSDPYFQATAVVSILYFITFKTDSYKSTQKLMLIK